MPEHGGREKRSSRDMYDMPYPNGGRYRLKSLVKSRKSRGVSATLRRWVGAALRIRASDM